MAKEISKKLHDKLKDIYPEGRSLDMDRRFTAKDVLDPNDPKDVKEWASHKDTSDLKGFDDKSAREPSVKKVVDKLSKGDRNYVEEDIDRFVDTTQEAGKSIQEVSDKIVDYNSMKDAVVSAWGKDLKGLSELADNLTERDFKALFNTEIFRVLYFYKNIEKNFRVISMKGVVRWKKCR